MIWVRYEIAYFLIKLQRWKLLSHPRLFLRKDGTSDFLFLISLSKRSSKRKQRQKYRLNFPLFAFRLKIFIVNFNKSPTSHARINHHGVKLHHFRGLRTRIGWTGEGKEGGRRLKTLINNKGRRLVKHFCRNYPPSRFLDEIFSRVWKHDGTITREWE